MAAPTLAACKKSLTSSHCRLLTLAAIHFIYVIIGSVVFQAIEGPGESESIRLLKQLRNDFRKNSSNCISEEDLESFIAAVIDANNRGVSAARNATFDPNWGFGASLFFAASVVTTIGYGHVAPLSDGGKAFCVIYALIGLPLTLVMLTAVTQRLLLVTNALLSAMLKRMDHAVSSLAVYLTHLSIVIIVVTVLAFLIPAALFMWMEPDWNYLDAIYYCFISLTTIGLGDYVPGEAPHQTERGLYKVIVSLYLFFGLVLMMLLLSTYGQIPQINIGSYFYLHPDYDDGDQSVRSWNDGKSKRADSVCSENGAATRHSQATAVAKY